MSRDEIFHWPISDEIADRLLSILDRTAFSTHHMNGFPSPFNQPFFHEYDVFVAHPEKAIRDLVQTQKGRTTDVLQDKEVENKRVRFWEDSEIHLSVYLSDLYVGFRTDTTESGKPEAEELILSSHPQKNGFKVSLTAFQNHLSIGEKIALRYVNNPASQLVSNHPDVLLSHSYIDLTDDQKRWLLRRI